MLFRLFSLCLVVALAPLTASAATMRSAAVVEGSLVTLGDLFDGAGPLAKTPVFRSPDYGVVGSVPTGDVIKAATAAGLKDIAPVATTDITIRRAGRVVDPPAIVDLVRAVFTQQTHETNDTMMLDFLTAPRQVYVDPGRDTPIKVSSLNYAPSTGHFDVTLEVARDTGPETIALSGTATPVRDVLVLAHSVQRGDVVSAADVTIQKLDIRKIRQDTITNPEDVVGQQSRRSIRSGEMISGADFEPQQFVKRGGLVTMTFKRGAMLLMARGRAQQNGTMGDVISVLNEQSKRIVQGTVTGVDQVTIDGGPAKLAAN